MSLIDKQRKLLQLFEHVGYPTKSMEGRSDGATIEMLQKVAKLPKGAAFSTFNSEHVAEAKKLYEILLNAQDFDDFLFLALTAREKVNEGLFVFAVSRSIIDCETCRGLLIPPIHEIFPDKFLPAETLNKAIKIYLDNANQEPLIIPIDQTGYLVNLEHRLAYFREDIGVNSHHWHWHLVFPYDGESKDRKGELFYYMHQQMCARYDSERLSVGLKRVVPFYDFTEVLDGYSPHLRSLNSGTHSGSRPDGMVLADMNHLRRWYERIVEAVHQGYLINREGKQVPLDPVNGIVFLGDMLEASNDSQNYGYYGNMHNEYHDALAGIHDPEGKFKELPGVLGDTTTAVRDPLFYRLHRFIDDIFNEHKIKFPAYEKEELDFSGVVVTDLALEGEETDVIFTYMGRDTMELSHAIQFKSSVKVEYEHLDHNPFSYNINVNNTTDEEKYATVRIFLGPAFDEIGDHFFLSEQRRYFIELDKFQTKLAEGENHIIRKSSDSSVTRSHIPSFQELMENEVFTNESGQSIIDAYCSCGWPGNMLVPRGSQAGMDFQLFVMLTDYDEDSVGTFKSENVCPDSASYCGVKNEKYPDRKSMGFPFDRTIPKAMKTEDFRTPNMIFKDIKIKFLGSRLTLNEVFNNSD